MFFDRAALSVMERCNGPSELRDDNDDDDYVVNSAPVQFTFVLFFKE